jgi:hypothetical protein
MRKFSTLGSVVLEGLVNRLHPPSGVASLAGIVTLIGIVGMVGIFAADGAWSPDSGSGVEASDRAAAPVRIDPDTLSWVFPVGERMEYSVTWEGIRLGAGSLTVEGIDTLRRRQAYRVALEMEGGPPFYRVEDRIVSWIQPNPFAALQFVQKQKEGNYRRDRRIEMDVEQGTYTRYDFKDGRYVANPAETAVPMPEGALDEIAYLFFARLLPLEVGKKYEFERYFKEDGNPATVEVLRREEIRVPAGRFQTVVLRPEIRTDGLFGEGGEAEVYITDDDRRILVRLTTSLSVGSGNLFLTAYEPGDGGALIAPSGEGEEDR